ncbi:MAG: NAD-dependent DNA ligase LigA [Saprospiraceae bacterium]|nr:NAD-dependent DNA ligase LigA [Saprospiraceae bacterium]
MYESGDEQALFQLTQQYLDSVQKTDNQQVEDLHTIIKFHEWKYYVLNSPIISDFEYDQLYKQLEALEAAHPDLITKASPTQRVSSDLTSDFETVAHLTPMLSLANSYNAEDLREFDQSIHKALDLEMDEQVKYTVEPKFDGGSIALVFEDDQLIRAATRGNGEKGDEITSNARTIRSIPLEASFSDLGISRIELRGEVIIRKENFKSINEMRSQEGIAVFANPRNAATGGLRMKDPSDAAKRGLEAFIYQISRIDWINDTGTDSSLASHWARMNALQQLGFKVPTIERKLCLGIDAVIDFCVDWEQKRENYPYEIDGMVVKVDSIIDQNKIGSTSHHPKWAIAYKFKAKQATARLLNVTYQVGKIGSITPVAKLEPVQLAGVTVSSVSLHNEDFINQKDLHYGDYVLVERAGDVIPYIVKALPELRDETERKVTFPKFCPMNSKEQVPLIRLEDESAWRCPNCTCGAQDLQRIIFHVSKSAMDIDGFGKSIVERFYDLGWIRTIADVYDLDYNAIAGLEGFGERSAKKLRNAIEKAKQNPIYRLLHSLSIHHLGKRASKILAAEVKHVFDLCEWTEEDLTAIKDIGPVLAKNLVTYFQDPVQIEILHKMERLGVNLQQTEADKPLEIAEDAPLSGKTILFTGTFERMSRKDAQEQAVAKGAKNISAVSGNLDILVVGAKAGSKLAKAKALGTVDIWNEEEFINRTQ